MSLVHADGDSFKDSIKEGIVLVDFYADWCGPCKMVGPILEDIAQTEGVNVVKVNVDSEQAIAGEFGIMSIPTLIIFKDGEPVSQKAGFQSKDMLLKWIEESKN